MSEKSHKEILVRVPHVYHEQPAEIPRWRRWLCRVARVDVPVRQTRQQQFDGLMRLLKMRSQVLDLEYNICRNKGVILQRRAEAGRLEVRLASEELTEHQSMLMRGQLAEARAREEYSEAKIRQWELELRALWALLEK